ncbi:MAG: 4-alpha-glucanotransferase [Christensenellaceae bacterium]|nr:4-alpha-glucanotransferase [Christensenellaceae bacterium]
MRRSGILMHITSLPGPGGVGSLGKEAYAFADFLEKSGMSIWQVLPMGPTGYGESPYQSSSIFAGNPLLISVEELRREGLLTYQDDEVYVPERLDQVNYDKARESKEKLLRRAFTQSEKGLLPEIRQFLREEKWLEDFALFTAVKQHFDGQMWSKWTDDGIRLRKPESVTKYRVDLDDEVRYHVFCQFIFRRQWQALKDYCNGKGISLFGDMPIYVAEDSADTWTHPEVFQMDKNRVPERVAGVPPDYFSADGQLWGNPLYRWTYLMFHGYGWWVDRMRAMARMYDLIRIDHFIGFANYYSIPHGAPNARTGKWIIGPGKKLFWTLKHRLPGLNVIAEDLGEVNDRVKKLLKYVGYPGMKVLVFAFGGEDENVELPGKHPRNCVAYTGTHDNATVLGFLKEADEATRKQCQRLLGYETLADAPAAFVRAVLAGNADTAIVPMQDVLGLDNDARMNLPGTIGGNWLWRMDPASLTDELADSLLALNTACNRRNAT